MFDLTMILSQLSMFIGAAWDGLRGPLAALLLATGGCLSMGCSAYRGSAKITNGRTETQFVVEWGTKIAIGFPGHFDWEAEGSGEKPAEAAK